MIERKGRSGLGQGRVVWIKKGFMVVVASCIVASMMPGVVKADSITVKLQGKPLMFEVEPQIVHGRTLVPLRAIFEALGAKLDWDATTRTATATKGIRRVVLPVDTSGARVGQRRIKLDVPPQIINGRTLVPLRFVSEALGAKVSYDATTRTVEITPEASPRLPNDGENMVETALAQVEWSPDVTRDRVQKILDVLHEYAAPYVHGELGFTPGTKVKIRLFENPGSYQYGLITAGLPEWLAHELSQTTAGIFRRDKKDIFMVAPELADQMRVHDTLTHEYYHFVLGEMTSDTYGKLPAWLEEGLAWRAGKTAWAEFGEQGQYEQLLRNDVAEVKGAVAKRRLLGLWRTNDDTGGGTYNREAHAAVVVRRLLAEKGEEKLKDYLLSLKELRHPEAFSAAFGESEDTFAARVDQDFQTQGQPKTVGVRLRAYLPPGVRSVYITPAGAKFYWSSSVPAPGDYTFDVTAKGDVRATAPGFSWGKTTTAEAADDTHFWVRYSLAVRSGKQLVDFDRFVIDTSHGEAFWQTTVRYFTDYSANTFQRMVLDSGVELRSVEALSQ